MLFLSSRMIVLLPTGADHAPIPQARQMALGATTAGIQTDIIGVMAIEIAKNNRIPLEKKYSKNLTK